MSWLGQAIEAAAVIVGWELARAARNALRNAWRRRKRYTYTSVDGRTTISVEGISAESFTRLINTIEKHTPGAGTGSPTGNDNQPKEQ